MVSRIVTKETGACVAVLLIVLGTGVASASGTMTLADALERARSEHPDLRAARLRVDAARARVGQQGSFQNPTLSVEVENLLGSGEFRNDDLAETTIYLTQPLELAGQRSKRERTADLEHVVADAEATLLYAAVLEAVAKSFAGVLAAEHRVALADGLAVGLGELRARAGSRRDREALDASIASARADLESEQVLLDLARRQLAIALGVGTEPPAIVGDLEILHSSPDLESLLAGYGGTAEGRLWQAKVDAREAALFYQRSLRVPDVSLSAGYRRFSQSDEQAAIFYLSVPLPLFDQKRGAVDAASFELQEARALRRSAELRWQSQVLEAHRALTSARRSAEKLGGPEAATAIPQDSLDDLEARHMQIRKHREYIDALELHHRAHATLERLSSRMVDP